MHITNFYLCSITQITFLHPLFPLRYKIRVEARGETTRIYLILFDRAQEILQFPADRIEQMKAKACIQSISSRIKNFNSLHILQPGGLSRIQSIFNRALHKTYLCFHLSRIQYDEAAFTYGKKRGARQLDGKWN